MIWIQTGRLSSMKTAFLVFLAVESGKPIITNLYMTVPHVHLSDEQFIIWMKKVMYINDEKQREKEIEDKFRGHIWLVDEAEFLFDARKFGSSIADLGTAFVRQLGKKDIDALLSCHILDSDVDKRVRGLADVYAESMRVDEQGNLLVLCPRKVDYPVFMSNDIWVKKGSDFEFYHLDIDLSAYYKYYDTEQIILMNRGGK